MGDLSPIDQQTAQTRNAILIAIRENPAAVIDIVLKAREANDEFAHAYIVDAIAEIGR